jgi:single-stranded-DNA-specific exonuclease
VKKFLVYGDYDVDGVTSSAELNAVLKDLGINVEHHIPHRVNDGYGLNCKIVDDMKDKKRSVSYYS